MIEDLGDTRRQRRPELVQTGLSSESVDYLTRLYERDRAASALHNCYTFRVIDAEGTQVGLVDWIWPDEARARHEFLGTRATGLRRAAHLIPASGMRVDVRTATVRVPYSTEQIKSAPRASCGGALTTEQKQGALSHYQIDQQEKR